MPETKNLCAQVPIELHERVNAEKEQANQTTSQYITNLITEYYKMKEIGGVCMCNKIVGKGGWHQNQSQ